MPQPLHCPYSAASAAQLIDEVASSSSAWGYIPLSLRSAAQPLYTRLPIIFSGCFVYEAAVGFIPSRASPTPAVRWCRKSLAAGGTGSPTPLGMLC